MIIIAIKVYVADGGQAWNLDKSYVFDESICGYFSAFCPRGEIGNRYSINPSINKERKYKKIMI